MNSGQAGTHAQQSDGSQAGSHAQQCAYTTFNIKINVRSAASGCTDIFVSTPAFP